MSNLNQHHGSSPPYTLGAPLLTTIEDLRAPPDVARVRTDRGALHLPEGRRSSSRLIVFLADAYNQNCTSSHADMEDACATLRAANDAAEDVLRHDRAKKERSQDPAPFADTGLSLPIPTAAA